MGESDIIKGCKRGDRRAFKAFVDSYSAYMFTICYRYMGNKEVAKDALQESLVQVINNISKYQEQGKFKSWVSTVTVKKCLDLLRKEKRHQYSSMEYVAEPGSEGLGSLKLEEEDVMQFIERIPENYRIAISMFLIEGYSHKEIAKHMSISESSSRSLVSRGRKMILESFEKENLYTERRSQLDSRKSTPTLKII